MALSKDVVIRLLGDSTSAQTALRAAAAEAEVSVSAYKRAERMWNAEQKAAEQAAASRAASMEKVGQAATVFGAVVAAGLAVSAKAAIDWESAWAGVRKVVDGTPAQMAELEGELRKLATTLPATHEEIAGVAEAAGQLGIARGDIVAFTETAIALGVSTNLSAEDAATGLARLSNIMGTSSGDVDRMGSSLVALGNAGASTEGDILAMGLRIAAAGRQAGMSEGEVLGMANAMSSLGIEAEAGGTAISTVIKKITSAVIDGGDELDGYAEVAGMSADAFATAWGQDAAGALTTFVGGLARVQAEGGNVNATLGDLALNDIRVSDTLLRLSGDLDGMTASLATGNDAWSKNTALVDEAAQRYATTESRLQMARNQINDAAIDIGSGLLPVLAQGAEVVADFARGFSELPGYLQSSVVVIGALAAGIGLVGGAAVLAVPKIAAFRAEMALLQASSSGAQRAVGGLGMLMTGPWGAAIGVATLALGGLVTWLGNSSKASDEAAAYQQELTSALKSSGGAIDDNTRALAANRAEQTQVEGSSLLEWAQRAGVALPTVTDALLGNRNAYREVAGALDAYAQAQLDAAGGDAGAVDLTGVTKARDAFGELAGQLGVAQAAHEREAAAAAKSGDAAAGATPQLEGAAGVLGEMAEEGEDAADAAETLANAIDALNGPTLNLRDAQRGYQEALDGATAAMAEHGATLDITSDAGRRNQAALDGIASSAAEQAKAILDTGGSYDAFRTSLDAARASLAEQAVAFGMTEAEAAAYVDTVLSVPSDVATQVTTPGSDRSRAELIAVRDAVAGVPDGKTVNVGVLSEAAMQRLRELGYTVQTLPDGTVNVTATTGPARTELDAFLRAPAVKYVQVVTQGDYLTGGQQRPARATGGPVWPGQTFLVGERGPELVRFGAQGYVTPADLTAQAMAAVTQPGPAPAAAAALAPAGPARAGGSQTVVNHRTFAPVFQVAQARPMSARELMDLARDQEFLHG